MPELAALGLRMPDTKYPPEAQAVLVRHARSALLLDEPIAAQDLVHQLCVLEVARRPAVGGDLNWSARIADRLVVMRRGRIYANDTAGKVLTRSMLTEVLGVDLEPGVVPAPECPFVPPQLAFIRPTDYQFTSTNNRRVACISP